ncbi:hypothetical protein BSLG_008407 [Batrachochytrium salamandrivorans]|nr:hypothetical protein BSLG_008407 [Batrachochytrium salamandrivorans]
MSARGFRRHSTSDSQEQMSGLDSPVGDETDSDASLDSSLLYMHPETQVLVSAVFGSQDYLGLRLKADHTVRPLWVSKTGRIILEAFSVLSSQAQDFLIAVTEPVSRPEHMHEYRLTEYSLHAAISVGLKPESIIAVLDLLSKCHLPKEVEGFIQRHASSFGKIKTILRENRYWLETNDDAVLARLTQDPTISSSVILGEVETAVPLDLGDPHSLEPDFEISNKVQEEYGTDSTQNRTPLTQPPEIQSGVDLFDLFSENDPASLDQVTSVPPPMQMDLAETPCEEIHQPPIADRVKQLLDQHDTDMDHPKLHVMEIHRNDIEIVKRRCTDMQLPVLEEYDFIEDSRNPNVEMNLKPFAKLRPYQTKGLSKVFGNGRARSGVIVLPCGSGKTLVGVAAACTVKKNCLVLCTSSTYTMITYSGKRAYDAQKLMEFIQSREWGLLILDEVHVVPAEMFRKVFTTIGAHAKLGLTATLVREDNKIDNLNYLIGPKLFEANWMELAQNGHIARVQCAQVWCQMTPEFFREFLREKSRKRQLLYTMNPRKVQACQYLVNFHEAMGDKIIVFSDNVFALKHYASKLHRPFIYGGTSQSERFRVLQQFRFNPALNTIFLSKVGDTSIDLPEASCLIQISSHYGSRRQEAQRLGRILRAKKGPDSDFNAYFYTLVSRDTEEMFYATKRQQFLIDQGYTFRIITHIEGMDTSTGLAYSSLKDQLELLNTVLISSESDYHFPAGSSHDAVEDTAWQDDSDDESEVTGTDWMVRSTSTLKSLSGADSMAYLEFNRGSLSGISEMNRRRYKK